jgi:exportin-2 (importin alpha re-exporter)
MICVFRTHLPKEYLLNLLAHIVRLLGSSHVVIQTYSSLCIERFLSVKDRSTTGQTVNRITKEHVTPHLQSLMTGLFNVLENPDLPENDYVMKCIMRVLSVIGADVVPITGLVLTPLTSALERVCANPSNPHFNHYLFECLAVLIKSVCTSSSPETLNGACDQFEALLFPPFQAVLSQDVVEFVPYVFQILAQLLNSRPKGTPLSDSYKSLFPPLLMPVLWDRKGNVPALTDLIRAYTCKGMAEIVQGNHLTAVLGVFQKLLASKVSEQFAFKLLDGLICNATSAALDPYIGTIFNLVLTKMQTHMKVSKTNKYCRMFIHSMCLYSAAFGGQKLYDVITGIDASLINTLITQVWSPNNSLCASSDLLEVNHMIVGGTNLLCNTPVNTHPELWGSLLVNIMTLIDVEGVEDDGLDDILLLGDEEAEEREFDSTYSRLAFAVVPDAELQNEVESPYSLFCTTLSTLCKGSPGSYAPVVQGVLTPRLVQILQQKMQESGQTIV